MGLAIKWTERARGDLRRIPNEQAQRIHNALQRLSTDRVGDVKKLAGVDDEWRLRVGEWRVRFSFTHIDDVETIVVLRVLPRQGAYRD